MTHPPLMTLPHSNTDKGVELFYAPSESIFAAVASEMVDLGWSVFPQASEGRLPGSVFGDMIKWGVLRDARVDAATLGRWKQHCATLNVACVFGPASGHAFAIDIDLTEAKLVRRLVDIADDILGYTPLRREGRAPKVALIYRHSETDAVRSVARTLAVDGDEKAMVEVQGAGKTLTFHGKHHRTGRYFKWLNDSPIQVGPHSAPLVTAAQVDLFLKAVEAAYGFVAAPHTVGVSSAGVVGNVNGYRIPKMSATGVTSGRWAVTNSVVFATVKANADAIYAAAAEGAESVEECKASIAAVALETWHETAVLGGKWSQDFLERTIAANARSTVASVISGRLAFRPPRNERIAPPTRLTTRPMLANLARFLANNKKQTNMHTGTAPCREYQ